MRLKEIFKILNDNLHGLNISVTPLSGTSNVKVDRLNQFRNAINNIEKTGLFKKEILLLKGMPTFASTLDSLTISSEQINHLNAPLSDVKNGIKVFTDSINENIPVEFSDNIISVKLPNKMDLNDLNKVIELLKKSLSIPLSESEINDTIEINSFESGSFWIDILVHSAEAVSLIAAITWAGAFIHKQYLESKIHWAYIESLGTKNEHLKDLRESAKKAMELLIETEAQNLEKDYYKDVDPERTNRLIFAIESMSKLIEKGTEVHPNLLASENLKSAFPSFKNINQIESKTKQIKNE